MTDEQQRNAKRRSHYTAEWRKARICARVLFNPAFQQRARYVRLVQKLAEEAGVMNRLIDQAVAPLQGRRYECEHAIVGGAFDIHSLTPCACETIQAP